MKETYTRTEVMQLILQEKKIYHDRIQRTLLDNSEPAKLAKQDAESALNALDYFEMNFDYND